jgi:8-oxo-dGTP diphosphatase
MRKRDIIVGMDHASAIICWNNKILLFLRDNKSRIPYPNHWQIPGGGIEEGETPLEAVKRELEEEASYVPKVLEFLGKVPKTSEKGEKYVYYSFVDDDEAKKFKIGQMEGQDVAFFTLAEIAKIKTTPGIDQHLKKYPKKLEEALKKKSLEGFILFQDR